MIRRTSRQFITASPFFSTVCLGGTALLVAGTGDAAPAVLAVRAWLWRCLEAHGQNGDGVRTRLDRTVAAMQDSMSDGMRRTFLENEAPPHWALVHLLRWQCVDRHAS